MSEDLKSIAIVSLITLIFGVLLGFGIAIEAIKDSRAQTKHCLEVTASQDMPHLNDMMIDLCLDFIQEKSTN